MAVIEIDPHAGFCSGVDRVLQMAGFRLEKGEEVYALGSLVHNAAEMRRLESLGLKTISHRQLAEVRPDRILIRAHGEPPSTYEEAGRLGIGIIEGTCPIVIRLQKKIRETHQAMDRSREQVVIFGKRDHPETIGLLGQAGGDAVVVEHPEEVSNADPHKRAILFAQTTMDPDRFNEVEARLKEHTSGVRAERFRSNCTICYQMRKRKPGLAAFAQRCDVVLFVSGKDSSNGRMLYEFSRSVNPETYWICEPGEIERRWLSGAEIVGISGATSTSGLQLEAVKRHVEKLMSS